MRTTIFDGIERGGCGNKSHCDECEFFRKHDVYYKRTLLKKKITIIIIIAGEKRETAFFLTESLDTYLPLLHFSRLCANVTEILKYIIFKNV